MSSSAMDCVLYAVAFFIIFAAIRGQGIRLQIGKAQHIVLEIPSRPYLRKDVITCRGDPPTKEIEGSSTAPKGAVSIWEASISLIWPLSSSIPVPGLAGREGSAPLLPFFSSQRGRALPSFSHAFETSAAQSR